MEKRSGSSKLFEAMGEIVNAIGRGLTEDGNDYSREMIADKLFDDAIETLRNRVDDKTIEKTRNKIKALEIYIKAVNETLDEYGYSRNREFRTTLQKKIDLLIELEDYMVFEKKDAKKQVTSRMKQLSEREWDRLFE